MKKVFLIISLFVVNISFLLFFVGLNRNINIWEYCVLGSGYLLAFSVSYFTEEINSIIGVLLLILFVNLLVNLSIFLSHFKSIKWGFLSVLILSFDFLIGLLVGLHFAMLLDAVTLVLIILSGKRKSGTYVDKPFVL